MSFDERVRAERRRAVRTNVFDLLNVRRLGMFVDLMRMQIAFARIRFTDVFWAKATFGFLKIEITFSTKLPQSGKPLARTRPLPAFGTSTRGFC